MDVVSTAALDQKPRLKKIALLEAALAKKFHGRLRTQPALSRPIVSFQANKERPGYRWYKYKEAFSASLVEYLLETYPIPKGPILEPFAGMGTTLFAAAARGFDADAIMKLKY